MKTGVKIMAIILSTLAAGTFLAACQTGSNKSGCENANQNNPDQNFHIYLCFGQSNMEGYNSTENSKIHDEDKEYNNERFQLLAAVDMPSYSRAKNNWYTASPPLVRQDRGINPVDYFGRTLVEKISDENIRIGVIVVAVSGAAIDAFDKVRYENYFKGQQSWMTDTAALYGGNPYARMVELAQTAQETGVIKGILIHQGETDAGDGAAWHAGVRRIYNNLLSDLCLEPNSIPLLAGQPVRLHHAQINQLPSVSSQFHVISSADCGAFSGGDGDHFTPAGMRLLGTRYGEKMYELLYQ